MRMVLATAMALALAGGAQAADGGKFVSFQGLWRLNVAETRYPAGIAITGNDMNVTKDDGAVLQYSETVTMDGKATTQTFDGAYDGKPRPIDQGQTLAFRHISATTYGAVRHNADGKVTERSACAISADGKKMTCRVSAYPPGAKPVKFIEVFDKAE